MAKVKIYGKRWRILGCLGEGGQGHVFRVKDTEAEYQGEFALKRVQNSSRRARFLNEINAITRLKHPHIIRLLDHSTFEDGDTEPQYLVMPIAEGGDLAHERRRKLYADNIAAVLSVSKQIASGLSAAHSAGVIHRDIKPANILSTGNGHDVWISDFGICFLRDVERHTEDAEVVGPRFFMAPELEDGGKLDVTPGADIYSLGKVIFFLITDGVQLPRERLHEEQFAKHLDKSEQHRFLGVLLNKMICPISERMSEMSEVIKQLDYIGEWQRTASQIPMNLATHMTIEKIRKKQLQTERDAKDDAERSERRTEARKNVVDSFRVWLQSEIDKTVEHIVKIGGINCSSQQARVPTQGNFRTQFDDYNLYESVIGFELSVESASNGVDFTRIIQFYLCEKLDVVRTYGYRNANQSPVADSEPYFAFLPIYRKISSNQPPMSSVELGYFSRRQFIDEVHDPMNRPMPTRKLDPVFDQVRLLARTFHPKISQYVVFRGSEWPGNVTSLHTAISEAIESFFEVVDTNASVNAPIPS